jgi:hypothetical protein
MEFGTGVKKTPSKIDGVPMAEIVETGNFKLASNIQKKIELRIHISIYILIRGYMPLFSSRHTIAFFR